MEEELKGAPWESADLPVRVANIPRPDRWPDAPKTWEELAALDVAQLLRRPNFGLKSLDAVRCALADRGLEPTGCGWPPHPADAAAANLRADAEDVGARLYPNSRPELRVLALLLISMERVFPGWKLSLVATKEGEPNLRAGHHESGELVRLLSPPLAHMHDIQEGGE